MKISIISASHRTNSQSKKILDVLHNNLSNIDSDLDIYDLDLADKLFCKKPEIFLDWEFTLWLAEIIEIFIVNFQKVN